MNQEEQQYRQDLIDTVLNYLGEHNDSRRLYEMFHDEMGLSHEDIEELGFDLSDCYPKQDAQGQNETRTQGRSYEMSM